MSSVDAAADYAVEIAPRWSDVDALWRGLAVSGAGTPFQHPLWLSAWYKTVAPPKAAEPLLVVARERGSGEVALVLPWIRRRDEQGLQAIEFADLGITDYNAPLLGPASPGTPDGARRLWRAIRRALPPADLLVLGRMPGDLGGRPNPLQWWPGVHPAQLQGHVIAIPGSWEGYHRGLERTFRKEIERSWRVFSRHDGAVFHAVTTPDEAERVMAALESQQRARIGELGLPYILDEEPFARHYRRLVQDGLGSGAAVLTCLTCGDEVVAALLGLRHGPHYAMVRLSTAGEAWKACSPGRLVIERTMAHLHAQGCTTFDFTIGDYAYKRRMGVAGIALLDARLPLSWRGWPRYAAGAARRAGRRYPKLVSLVRRWTAPRNAA